MAGKLASLFDVKPGEGRLVALLLAHSFFMGVALVLFETAASGLFLSRFAADSLPFAFIGAALVVPTTGVIYSRLQRRLAPAALWTSALAALLVMQLALVALVQLTTAAWPSLLMMALTYVMSAITALEFWGLAGRVLDLRQAKRLYGLIGGGETAAGIVGGASVAVLVKFMALVYVLAIAAASLGICWLILVYLLRTEPPKRGEEDDAEEPVPGGLPGLLRAVLRDRYVLGIVGLYLFYNLSHDTLDYLNLVQVQSRYERSSEEVAGFLGALYSFRQLVVLFARTLLSGRLLARFGLGAGLTATPSLVIGSGAMLIALALLGGAESGLLFWPVVMLKVLERITWNSLGKPAVLVAYRPLAPQRRDRAQLFIETAVEPLATGLTGVLLLGLAAAMSGLGPTGKSIGFTAFMAATAIGWFVMGRRLKSGYTDVVLAALQRGTLRSVVLSLDEEALSGLGEWLRRSRAAEVGFVLGVAQESLAPKRFSILLAGLLEHEDAGVRADVLTRIEALSLGALLPRVSARLDVETEPHVREALLRALASLGDVSVMARIEPFLDDADPKLRRSALTALLKYAGIAGVLAAGRRLMALLSSERATDRAVAAAVVGEVGIPAFYHPLRGLLADADPLVRASALEAAGALRHPSLWPVVARTLATRTLWQPASEALARGGVGAMPALQAELDRPDLGRPAHVRIIRILGRMRDPRAMDVLRELVRDRRAWLRREALAALCACGWRAPPERRPDIEGQLREEVATAAAVNAAIVDLGQAGSASILRRSLEQDMARARDNCLSLLALLYRPEALRQVRIQLRSGSPERKTYALEVLDNVCGRRHTASVLPLLEGLAPEALARRLSGAFPEAPLGRDVRLEEIAAGRVSWVTGWMRAFARHAIGLKGGAVSEEGVMESTIHKVILLKSVEFFATTDDDILAELATTLTEVEFKPGDCVIERGKTEACMYIVESGEVRVHDGDTTLATLGARAVFGELSALDPQPRSATITAVQPTTLLRIDHATIVDLMAEHIEVAHGIVKFLIRRYGRPATPPTTGPLKIDPEQTYRSR